MNLLMSERVVRLRPPAMHSRAYPFRRGLISNIEHIYGFSLSRWNEKGRKLLSTESGPWHRQLRDRKEVDGERGTDTTCLHGGPRKCLAHALLTSGTKLENIPVEQ